MIQIVQELSRLQLLRVSDTWHVWSQVSEGQDRGHGVLHSHIWRGITRQAVTSKHFVSTWPNVCGSMLGLLKHGILITAHNSFKYVCLCVCLCMHMCTILNKARRGCEITSHSSYWQLWTICHHCWKTNQSAARLVCILWQLTHFLYPHKLSDRISAYIVWSKVFTLHTKKSEGLN